MEVKMKNTIVLLIVFVLSALLAWTRMSYADWGHHGDHQYYHYHDHPHYGLHVASFYPDEYYPVAVGGSRYYYDDGLYYSNVGGDYVVVAPPVGAVVSAVPPD